MKPFDIEAAQRGEKVITRDGREFKLAGYNPNASGDDAICGWVNNRLRHYTKEGTYLLSMADDLDLFMAPVEHEVWLNVYDCCSFAQYKTKEEADKGAAPYRIACIKVIYKEGEGL